VRWQETALLALLKVRLVGGAKPNVPFAGWHRISKFFVRWTKKLKHRRVGNECRLTRCPIAIWSVCWSPVKMVYFLFFSLQFDVVVSFFTLAGNVLQLPEGGDFEALHCQPSRNFDRCTKLDLTTEPPLLGRCCYAQGFISVCVLRFLKYSNISSFVILDNFSLNLSRC
jgi:hypothetical protein